jgi:hypothetical protein
LAQDEADLIRYFSLQPLLRVRPEIKTKPVSHSEILSPNLRGMYSSKGMREPFMSESREEMQMSGIMVS